MHILGKFRTHLTARFRHPNPRERLFDSISISGTLGDAYYEAKRDLGSISGETDVQLGYSLPSGVQLMADAKVVARVDPGLGNPYEKAKLRAQLEKPVGPEPDKDARGSAYGKSSKFFEQLQRDVHAAVHGSEKDVGAAPGGAKKKQKRAPKKANAAKL